MKFNAILLTSAACLALAACSSAPKNPVPSTSVGVIEEVQDIKAFPDTKNNKAKLIKLENKCIIEFTGMMDAGKARENWTFQGNTLYSATSTVVAKDGSSTAQTFDLYDKGVQTNFLALKKNFSKENLEHCNTQATAQ